MRADSLHFNANEDFWKNNVNGRTNNRHLNSIAYSVINQVERIALRSGKVRPSKIELTLRTRTFLWWLILTVHLEWLNDVLLEGCSLKKTSKMRKQFRWRHCARENFSGQSFSFLTWGYRLWTRFDFVVTRRENKFTPWCPSINKQNEMKENLFSFSFYFLREK